jgi:hypothetical protein
MGTDKSGYFARQVQLNQFIIDFCKLQTSRRNEEPMFNTHLHWYGQVENARAQKPDP